MPAYGITMARLSRNSLQYTAGGDTIKNKFT